MAITVSTRPPQLDGCFKTWDEQAVDVVDRTKFDTGNLRTRRRFTGRAFTIQASVTLKNELYPVFKTWFEVNQRQGAVATTVKDPLGNDLVVQFVEPPTYAFGAPGTGVFTATVKMYHGAEFP